MLVPGAAVLPGAAAVVLNVTVTAPTRPGNITAYPDLTTEPTASNLNFVAGETIPNLVVVGLGSDGKVALTNNSPGTVQLIADVSGFYMGGGTPSVPGAFEPVSPTRLLDTRIGKGVSGPVAAHGTVHLQVTGATVPAGASAVVVNVTETAPMAAGNVTVYPDLSSEPTASNLNFVAGETTPNLVVVGIGGNGKVSLTNNSPGSVQLIADVSGYFVGGGTPSAAGVFVPLTPARLMDTRIGKGWSGSVSAYSGVGLQVTGTNVPAGASAAVLNVTVTQPTRPGNLSVYSADPGLPPTASNLNFLAEQTVPNLVMTKLSSSGAIVLNNNSSGTVQLIVDIAGYYLAVPPRSYTLSVVAGTCRSSASASSECLHAPTGVAVDSNGNTYIADEENYAIEKVTPGGVVSVVAGNGRYGPPTPGPATSSALGGISGVAVDAAGDVYISDDGNAEVDKVTPDGTLSIFAGTGQQGYPASGPATSSDLYTPGGLALDSAGDLYVADSTANRIEKITPGGVLTTIAGTSAGGGPCAVAVDSAGNLYVADCGTYVSKFTPGGTTSIVAGTGKYGSPTPGPAIDSDLYIPDGLAVDSAGDLYIADEGNHVVERVTPGGTLSIVAGGGTGNYPALPTPGPATSTILANPSDVTIDSAGNLYISDLNFNLILKVTNDGILSILAGNGSKGGAPTPGPAANSHLNRPNAVALDAADNVYIADTQNNVIEKVTPAGTLSVVAGNGALGTPTPGPATQSHLDQPDGVAVDTTGNLYIADYFDRTIEKVTPAGTLSIFAGNGGQGLPTPGPATNSALSPMALAVDTHANLYVADPNNNMIEKITPGGILSIAAGDGVAGPVSYGFPATRSHLNSPDGITVDSADNLYIADTHNNEIDEVNHFGNINAVVMNLDYPSAVATDSAGNVYVPDFGIGGLSRLEKFAPSGTMTTFAGTGACGSPTPGPATSSELCISGIAVDSSDNVYVADYLNNDVEKLTWGYNSS